MITSGGAATLNAKAFVAVIGVPAVESTARSVKEKLPLVVGVPDNTPLGDSAKPPGKVPATVDHAYGAFPPLRLKL